jgi:hypothetical protein
MATVWPVVVLGYGAYVWWQRHSAFYVFANGFVDVRGGRVTGARWTEVEELFEEHSVLVIEVFPWWSHRFRIRLSGRPRALRLDGTVRELPLLIRAVLAGVRPTPTE